MGNTSEYHLSECSCRAVIHVICTLVKIDPRYLKCITNFYGVYSPIHLYYILSIFIFILCFSNSSFNVSIMFIIFCFFCASSSNNGLISLFRMWMPFSSHRQLYFCSIRSIEMLNKNNAGILHLCLSPFKNFSCVYVCLNNT